MTAQLWQTIRDVGSDPDLEPLLKQTALALVCGQMFYWSNPHQRRSYQLVVQYQSTFVNVLGHIGLILRVDEIYQVAYVIPEVESSVRLSKAESLLALVLRRIYGVKVAQGDVDAGIVRITIESLFSTYAELTEEELASGSGRKGRLRHLVDVMQRYGFVRAPDVLESVDAPVELEILPGIALVINMELTARLKRSFPQNGPTPILENVP